MHLAKLRQLIDIVARRKALILTSLLLGVTIGLVVYFITPKAYKSTALLSYQQQKVNPSQMSPDSDYNIISIVSTLTQIITSRSNLEKIIIDERLYTQERQTAPLEDIIQRMRDNIAVTPAKEGDIFRISYLGKSPEEVVRVANNLAARFIEEHMKFREEKASETSAYTQDELNMAKEMLDKKEAIMRDYKLKYFNEMPDQRTNNMTRLIALQSQYMESQNSIQDLERTKVQVQDQIAFRKQILAANDAAALPQPTAGTGPGKDNLGPGDLERLRLELQTLQIRFTENHPRIKDLTRKIAHLEEAYGVKPRGGYSSKSDYPLDEVLIALRGQLKGIDTNIETLKKGQKNIQALIDQYERWVEAAPVREAEWAALSREHGEFKRHYDFLVSQNLQAGSALNLERRQKGSQFKVVDPAQISEKPEKPDFIKIMRVAILISTAFGCGIALALEIMDTSFKTPAKLEDTFGIEVICSVPRLALRHEVRRKRLRTTAGTILFIVSSSTLLAVIVVFWKQGRIVF